MSIISASTTSTTAYKVTADTTGTLVLQTGATPTTAVTIGTDQSVTTAGTINGLTVGKGAGAVSTNTAVGASALAANTTGNTNTAIGGQTLALNTTGANNTAVGYQSSYGVTTAPYITSVGYQSNYTGQTAGNGASSVLGYQALYNSTNTNDAFGYRSQYATTSGYFNASFGFASLLSNTTGIANTAIGTYALQANTTASGNTALGYQAGYTNSTGGSNVYLGQQAGYSATGTGNVFVGSGAGYYVTSGAKNTIIGRYDGNQANYDIRTQNNCIVISDGDGNPRIGFDIIGMGQYLNVSSGSRYTQLTFANNMVSKSIMYWDNTLTNLYVQNASGGVYLTNTGTSWTSNSDERLKENLTPIENGLSKVCSLRSVIGNFINDETKKPTPFLIAQDVQAVLPEAVTTSTLKGDETNTEYLGVAYTEVIPLLVAAIKELKAEIDTLKGQA